MTKWIFLIALALAAVAFMAGCGQKEEQTQVKETAEGVQVVSAKVVDPVCGMEVDPKTTVTAEYMGQTYYFCSAQCRDDFLKSPEKYVSIEEGIDPVCGMKVDPRTALQAEYEGQMYYFCSADCKEKFLQDPEKYKSAKASRPHIPPRH